MFIAKKPLIVTDMPWVYYSLGGLILVLWFAIIYETTEKKALNPTGGLINSLIMSVVVLTLMSNLFQRSQFDTSWQISILLAIDPFLIVGGYGIIRYALLDPTPRSRTPKTHLRGSQLITPYQLIRDVKRQFNAKTDAHILYVGVDQIPMPLAVQTRHLAVIGQSGTGKTQFINQLLEQSRKQFKKVVIVDISGEYYARFARQNDIVLSISHAQKKAWSPYAEQTTADQLAASLIEQSQSNAFWHKSGRAILSAMFRMNSTLNGFKADLDLTDMELIEKLDNHHETMASKIFGTGNNTQSSGIGATVRLDMSFFRHLRDPNDDEPLFSITNWALSQGTEWLFLTCTEDELEEVRPLLRVWLDLVSTGVLKRDEKGVYPMMMCVIDELASVGQLHALPKALQLWRKFNAMMVVGYQNNAQIEDIYGSAASKNIKDQLQSKIIFRSGDVQLQQELSKLLGSQEVEEKDVTTSQAPINNQSMFNSDRESIRYSHKIAEVLLPSELSLLRDGECYLKFPSFNPTKTRIEFKEWMRVMSPDGKPINPQKENV